MKASLRLARFWFQLAFTAGFLVLLAWRVDISEALSTLPDADWVWVVPGLLLFTASKAVHALRWKVFLGKQRQHVPYTGLLGIFLVHNMANAVLLLRAGDVLRIQTTSQRYNIPRSELTATVVVVETLFDGLAFVALVALAASLGVIPSVLRATFWTMAGLALIGVAIGVIAARWVTIDALATMPPLRWLSSEFRNSAISILRQFREGMRTLRHLELAIPAFALSLAGWFLEAEAYWVFGHAFGLDLPWSGYLLIMMTANFAVSIPITPSGIGPYEVATQELVVALGGERALATGYAIGMHLCMIIWITMTGLIAMWLMKLRPNEIFYIQPATQGDISPQVEPT
jgi:uncharacterized protein (TIRG00374 family)